MRHRGPLNMPLRYAVVAVFGLAMCLVCVGLITRRREFEPVVRLLHPLMLGRGGYRYDATAYSFYELLAGFLGVLPLLVIVYGWATKARTDRKIDAYLQGRLPRHEQTLTADRTDSRQRKSASGFGADPNDRK